MIFILVCLPAFADENRILITGFTKHELSTKDNGERYNDFNYGAGYEYTTFNTYDEFYLATNFTILKDSFDEAQYTISVSPNIRFNLAKDFDLSFGAAAFVMWKKDTFKKGVSVQKAKYDLLLGVAPLSSLYYKDLSVNFAYVPTLSYKRVDTIGFAIVYFGWKI